MIPSKYDPASVNPTSFVSLHDELFKLEKGTASDRFKWVKVAIHPSTNRLNQCYRMFGRDLDTDIFDVASELGNVSYLGTSSREYYLRLMWRKLMRNYAFWHAVRLEPRMMPDRWLWWRLVSGYSLPRLWAALMLGYAVLLGNSGLQDILCPIAASHSKTRWSIAVLLVASFIVGSFDVERRIGRRFGALVRRSIGLFCIGTSFAAIGTMLCWCVCNRWGFVFWLPYQCLSAALALFFAHLLQLFWHEYSTSEPV
jgi:hypothetical protein